MWQSSERKNCSKLATVMQDPNELRGNPGVWCAGPVRAASVPSSRADHLHIEGSRPAHHSSDTTTTTQTTAPPRQATRPNTWTTSAFRADTVSDRLASPFTRRASGRRSVLLLSGGLPGAI
ncbi:Hypp9058 [Branchiostoma lanceolatum]|uniref:Hypp9058 protein n=1 Tax=Branchiostoma lanceolatum TaxID=7740 RepID=A0A8J9ZBN6_BRALA|nr:Hypp9058 [Branchiostoma lanceolatum]